MHVSALWAQHACLHAEVWAGLCLLQMCVWQFERAAEPLSMCGCMGAATSSNTPRSHVAWYACLLSCSAAGLPVPCAPNEDQRTIQELPNGTVFCDVQAVRAARRPAGDPDGLRGPEQAAGAGSLHLPHAAGRPQGTASRV